MAVTLLSNGQPNSLSERRGKKVGGVRKQGESRQQFRNRMDGQVDPNADISAIFKGIQGTRGMIRRNLDGTLADPYAPGGLDAFYAKNPHLRGAAERQAQYDQQAREALPGRLQSAVAERRAQQEMQSYNPNLVTGADGYRTIFDPKGKVVGTTRPMQAKTMWSQDNAINRGTASGAEQSDFANALQDTGVASASGKPHKQNLKGLDKVFPGQSSPPGGASGGRVGPPQVPGDPGGETLFGQVPEFSSGGMAQNNFQMPTDTPQRVGQQSRMKYFAPGNLSEPQQNFVGPQLPQFSLEQQDMLRSLFQPSYGLQQTKDLASNPRIAFTDLFPGNDYQAIRQGFPEMAGSSVWGIINQLRQLASHPAIYPGIFNR